MNDELFSILPHFMIESAVSSAFMLLNEATFGNIPLADLSISSQIECGLFHELIVHEISKYEGWRPGLQKKDCDLVHDSGLQIQVKTKSDPDGIAGNRYTNTSNYTDPSGFYLCVNFIPRNCICKIRAGWVEADGWKPQSGKGNAATLKKEARDSLEWITGPYIKGIHISALKGFGEKVVLSLQGIGIERVYDFFDEKLFEKGFSLLNKAQKDTLLSFLEKEEGEIVC